MERIVVTGYGIKAPGIQDVLEFKEVLDKGICTLNLEKGIGPNGSDLVCGIIYDAYNRINGRNYKRYPRVARLAVAAADEAIGMSGTGTKSNTRTSIIMGTSVGGLAEIEKYAEISNSGMYERFPAIGAGAGNPHSVSSAVAYHAGTNGLAFTMSTGCTAGVDSIVLAKSLLETNQTDICIVGGADSPLSTGSIYSFHKLGALSKEKDILAAGVPFSTEHEGFVLSEGAAALILEREQFALNRGAKIYGVIDNIVSNNDGQSIFGSDKTGDTMIKTLKHVVGNNKPCYLNSQALGLRANDQLDEIAVKSVFHNPIPITSIKGMIGHAFGASGIMQAVASLISIEHNFIPPTIKTSGVGYELSLVLETRYTPVTQVVITSHGYGGNNTCMLISRYRNDREG